MVDPDCIHKLHFGFIRKENIDCIIFDFFSLTEYSNLKNHSYSAIENDANNIKYYVIKVMSKIENVLCLFIDNKKLFTGNYLSVNFQTSP